VSHDSRRGSAEHASDGGEAAPSHSAVQASAAYSDLEHFIVTISDTSDREKAAVVASMTPGGLFFWQVTRIDL
jgi:hypothetical protein